MIARLGAVLAVGLALACFAGSPAPPREPAIPDALEDLRAAGFEFEADVRFRVDPYAVCEALACAEVEVIAGRRTILVAPDALRSAAALRATLLEVWERYREPRRGSTRDLARGAHRVAQDGARAGVDDPRLIAHARRVYEQLYRSLRAEERAGLPDPHALD